ncbi:FG-GAP-like repeat-containing protein [Teredinibacter sp. KSP-S5-2]|uniref:FG-GAP-like repeat-containing protein n=1 Tax=Teredinibacter sp. KSP-S5-2 TaxID=3034506 RepID=UPI0029342B2F|nr:FG-GAP-like repeat-containing protein [Teredinibacter sp. KSP-S5-2]WNO08554.1 FG-GAP-like repeat-containing protein [Teredinibacter sp. KSP-S5-2]
MSYRSVLFLLLSLIALLSTNVVAVEFDQNKFDVYHGDIDGDGDQDIYLKGKQQVILLHGDIITPVVLPSPKSFVIYKDSSTAYSSPVLVELTEAQLVSLILFAPDMDYVFEDVDADGLTDFRLLSSGSNPSLVVIASSDSDLPSQVNVIAPRGLVNTPILPMLADASSIVSQAEVDATDQTSVAAGVFKVNESGAATYSFPIMSAVGTAGVTPQVSLNYISSGPNGTAGLGWHLASGGAITRCGQTLSLDRNPGSISWGSDDRFCINGQRLLVVSGSYGSIGSTYKTEVDGGLFVTAVGGAIGNPDYFKVEGKDGSHAYYGGEGIHNSEQTAYDEAGNVLGDKVLTWAESHFEDSVGNPISYTYINDQTLFALDRINFAYGQSPNPGAHIKINYQEREDYLHGYVSGYRFNTRKRIVSIDSFSNGNLLRKYKLNYDQRGANISTDKLSRLSGIEECVSTTNCLPETKFEWKTPNIGIPSNYTKSISLSNSNYQVGATTYLDINGDGRRDLAWVGTTYANNQYTQRIYYAFTQDGSSQFTEMSIGNASFTSSSFVPAELVPIDYNGDGRQDLLVKNTEDPNNQYWKLYLSEPRSGGEWRLVYRRDLSLPSEVQFADFNSDGLSDAITGVQDNNQISVYYLQRDSLQPVTSDEYYKFSTTPEIFSITGKSIVGNGASLPTLVDLNGDGKSDIVVKITGNIIVCSAPNCPDPRSSSIERPSSFLALFTQNDGVFEYVESIYGLPSNYDVTQGMSSPGSYFSSIPKVKFADFNTDGLPDLAYFANVQKYNANTKLFEQHGNGWRFLINTGNGFSNPTEYFSWGDDRKIAVEFADYNQDKHPDILAFNTDRSRVMYFPWNPALDVFDPTGIDIFVANYLEENQYSFNDINADGAVDFIRTDFADKSTYIHNGLHDLKNSGAYIYSIEDGIGNKTNISYASLIHSGHYTSNEGLAGVSETQYESCYNTLVNRERFEVKQICETQTMYSLNKDDFYRSVNDPFADLATEDNRLISSYYAPVIEYAGAIPVVTSVSSRAPSSSDNNATNRVDYHYHQLRVQPGGVGFLGYQALTTLDVQRGVTTTTTYRQDWPYVGRPKSTIVSSNAGVTLRKSKNAYSVYNYDALKNVDVSTQGFKALGSLQIFDNLSEETQYELVDNGQTQGGALSTTQVAKDIDSYGNVISLVEKIRAGSNDTNEIDTDFFVETSTVSEFGSTVEEKRLGRLSSATVTVTRPSTSPATSTKSSEFTYYDVTGTCSSGDFAHGGVLTGMLCEEKLVIDNTNIITTRHFYDQFGNETFTSTLDHGAQKTRLSAYSEFDVSGRYIESTYDVFSNALTGETPSPDANYNDLANNTFSTVRKVRYVQSRDIYGAPISVNNNNGNSITVSVSATTPFGTPYFSADSSGGYMVTTASKSNLIQCPVGAVIKQNVKKAGGGEAFKCSDILGRTIRTAAKGFDGSWVFTDSEYDSLNHLLRKSEPYRSGDAIYWTSINASDYDIFDRANKVTLPFYETDNLGMPSMTLATTRISHSGFSTTEINTQGHQKITTKNVLGEVVSVQDNMLSISTYVYDVNGNLKNVTDPNSNVISMNYDVLGNKTYMNDPDKGEWYYKYNNLGELTCQMDSLGNIVESKYDFKGRLVERIDYAASAGSSCDAPIGTIVAHAFWVYDVISENGTTQVSLGNLQQEFDSVSGYSARYGYDILGRMNQKATTIPGSPAETQTHYQKTTYDQYGRTFQIFDSARNGAVFDSAGVQHFYNNYGFLSKVSDAEFISGASVQDYYEILSMDTRGNITEYDLGGGVTSTSAFYNARSGLIERLQAHTGLAILQDMEMRWDHGGNLAHRHDTGVKKSGADRNLKEAFTYDSLNRLTNYNVTGDVTHSSSVDYDEIGNITYKSDVGSYSYLGYGPHAVSSAGNVSYAYDAAGNMTNDGRGRTLAYTTFNKIQQLEKAGRKTNFYYSTGRNRYKRVDTDTDNKQTTRLYIGSVEKVYYPDGSVHWKRNIGGIAQVTHKFNASDIETERELLFMHKDHLGSINLMTNAVGDIVQEMAFDPWGERRNTDTWQDLVSAEINSNFFVSQKPFTIRGFTGHEMVDEMEIIHMNGRIYDAKLGRFLQADPHIQEPTNIASLNRYSYVLNNPLNATDPSGFFFKQLSGFKAFVLAGGRHGPTHARHIMLGYLGSEISTELHRPVFNWLAKNPDIAMVVQIVVTVVVGYFCPPCVIGVAAFFAKNMTYAQTGDKTMAYRAGARAGAVAAATYAIGVADHSGGLGTGATRVANKVILHGMVGGINAELSGGDFGSGFAAAGFTAAVNSQMGSEWSWGDAAKSAIAGGTSSALTGGKFANGAATGVFVYVLNSASQSQHRKSADAKKGVPVTDEERAYAADGNRKAFWTSRAKRGDPMGQTALDIVNDDGLITGKAANFFAKLGGQINGVDVDLEALGVDLMRAHVRAVDLDKHSIPHYLNAEQVQRYHLSVFEDHSIPTRFYGGNIPFNYSADNPIYFVHRAIYCPDCDKAF